MEEDETEFIGMKRLKELKETKLLKSLMYFLILPGLGIGLVGMFVPYIYIFIPVFEAD